MLCMIWGIFFVLYYFFFIILLFGLIKNKVKLLVEVKYYGMKLILI